MFLIIDQGQVKVSEEELSLSLMQHLVGVEGEDSYIEIISNQFSDPNIDFLVTILFYLMLIVWKAVSRLKLG